MLYPTELRAQPEVPYYAQFPLRRKNRDAFGSAHAWCPESPRILLAGIEEDDFVDVENGI